MERIPKCRGPVERQRVQRLPVLPPAVLPRLRDGVRLLLLALLLGGLLLQLAGCGRPLVVRQHVGLTFTADSLLTSLEP